MPYCPASPQKEENLFFVTLRLFLVFNGVRTNPTSVLPVLKVQKKYMKLTEGKSGRQVENRRDWVYPSRVPWGKDGFGADFFLFSWKN